MIACPFEIPKYSWEDSVPYVQKCHLCYERLTSRGESPACVTACPEGATIFGEREDLLKEARTRIDASPGKYIDRIWGEHEVGGTSVLYLSDVELNLTELDESVSDSTPMPERTFKVLGKMPSVFVGMAAAMGGIYWVVERRRKLAEKTESDDAAKADDDV